MEKADNKCYKELCVTCCGSSETSLYIHFDMVLAIKSFVFLRHLLIHNNLLVLILLFNTGNLLFSNNVFNLALKQTYEEIVNWIKNKYFSVFEPIACQRFHMASPPNLTKKIKKLLRSVRPQIRPKKDNLDFSWKYHNSAIKKHKWKLKTSIFLEKAGTLCGILIRYSPLYDKWSKGYKDKYVAN